MTQQEAEVKLRVNSKEAHDKINKLEKEAEDLRKKFNECFRKGDIQGLRKTSDELNKVNKQIQNMRTNAANIKAAMKRIDEASPRELKRTLKMINTELNSGRVPRGSKEWKEYCEQVKRVKRELAEVNSEMEDSGSLLDNFKDKFNDWGAAAAASVAAFAGIVMSGKAAVQSFADMEAEEANVRKFTGMTAEEVKRLNDEFKKIDTRTSREDLNKLAQEAGRLGKQSQEDVLGFVVAANQINVALDDLGEGATLTLSKLTGIFGDEARLGTERSLLAVGSVINELSQNCTASAPYLADFSKRLAGVGAQAGMTIPQIMAFAAVLDTQGQAVEMSATAFSQLILKLYKDPAKFANAAGLDVAKFSELLKNDANEAVLTLLDSLNKMGNIEALAPIFAEMGMDGARASGVMAALAGNIDAVRRQQENANIAFSEATSVTNEYNVQNNTVQAGLDKAKKGFTEMSVALGEKLVPVMRYAISGTSMLMRIMSKLIEFVIQYKTTLIVLTATVVSYYTAVKFATIAEKALAAAHAVSAAGAALWKVAMTGMSVVAALLSGNMTRAAASVKLFSAALKTSPIGLAITLIGALATGLTFLIDKQKNATKHQKLLNKTISESIASWKSENDKINDIFNTLKKAKEGSEDYREAKAKLMEQYGQYLGDLIDEKGRLIDLATAYERVAAAVRHAAAERTKNNAIDSLKESLEKDNKPIYERLFGYIENFAKDKSRVNEYISWVRRDIERLGAISDDTKKRLNELFTDPTGGRTVAGRWRTIDATVALINQNIKKFDDSVTDVEARFGSMINRFSQYSKEDLTSISQQIQDLISLGENSNLDVYLNGDVAMNFDSLYEAKRALEDVKEALASIADETGNATETPDNNTPLIAADEDALKKQLSKLKEANDIAQAQNLAAYATGTISYKQYLDGKQRLDNEYLTKRLSLYKDAGATESSEYSALLTEQSNNLLKELGDTRKRTIKELEDDHDATVGALTAALFDPDSPDFQNQKMYNQRVLEEDINLLRAKAELYQEGEEERLRIEQQIEDLIAKDQLEKQKETAKAYEWFRQNYSKMSEEDRYRTEISMLEDLHNKKLISEKQYLDALNQLRKKNDEDERSRLKREQEERYKVIEGKYEGASEIMANSTNDWGKSIMSIMTEWDKLMDDIANGGDTWTNIAKIAQASLALIGSMLSQYTTYANAERDAEIAKIESRYDKEIEAAGSNTKKKEKLEKEKAEATNKIKKKYADRAMKIELAQALAQTAVNALLGYQAGLKFPFPANTFMPAILAGLATAQGALQIATIKKQHEAETAAYYTGGFTGGKNYRREAGVVHEGEFVANHNAVNNPQLAPIFRVLDAAQRNNTVGSLTAEDVSIALTQGLGVSARGDVMFGNSQPTVISNVIDTAPIEQLAQTLENGITCFAIIDGEQGFHRKYTQYLKLINNPKR